MSFDPHRANYYLDVDKITLGNRRDKNTSHIEVFTAGDIDENDIHLKTCNVKINDGYLTNTSYRHGTTEMISFPNNSSIDFKNMTPLNLDKADKDANNNFSSDQNFKDIYIDGDGENNGSKSVKFVNILSMSPYAEKYLSVKCGAITDHYTLTLPAVTGNIVADNATQSLSNKSFSDDVGIGTDSPSEKLHIVGGTDGTDSHYKFVPKLTEGIKFDGTAIDALVNEAVTGELYLQFYSDNSMGVLKGSASTKRYLYPNTDDKHDFGTSSLRWDNIYATNSTIQTSDRRKKTEIIESDLGLDFINKLKPVKYRFRNKKRTHYGLIAQDVESILKNVTNHRTKEFAGYIYNDGREPTKEEFDKMKYDNPDLTDKEINSKFNNIRESRYGLRYTEFISPMIKAIQELYKSNQELIKRVEELEKKV